MANKLSSDKVNYLRWFTSIALIIVLSIHLLIYKTSPSYFHFFIVVVLLILSVADRFKVIRIPGVVELRDNVEAMDKKLDVVVRNVQQIQMQGLNIYFNPQSQTETGQYKPGQGSPQANGKRADGDSL